MQLSVYKLNVLVASYDFKENDETSKENVQEYFLGRAEDCHIILNDATLSRYQASIICEHNAWKIINRSSFGQVFHNGIPIQEKGLVHGDSIRLGPFLINIVIPQKNIIEDNKLDENINSTPSSTVSPPREDKEALPEVENKEEVASEDENSIRGLSVSFDGDVNSVNKDQFQENEGLQSAVSVENLSMPTDGEMDFKDQVEEAPVVQTEITQTKQIKEFVNFELKIQGEYAPYDKFKLSEKETFIGRDNLKCQIVLNDKEVSTLHAVIRKEGSFLLIEDLKSANGTILNGSRINTSPLKDGDEFVIGQTSFTVSIVSALLSIEANRLMPVESNQSIEVEEVVEESIDFNDSQVGHDVNAGSHDESSGSNVSQSKSLFSKDALKDPAKRKKILIIVIVLLALWVFLDDSDKDKKDQGKTKAGSGTEKTIIKSGDGKDSNGDSSSDEKTKQVKKRKKAMTQEERAYVEESYILAKELFAQGRYAEAQLEIDKVMGVSEGSYKEADQLRIAISEGLKKIKEEEEKKQKELENKKKKLEVEKLLEKAREAVEKRNVVLAEGLFTKIMEIDPEQSEVTLLKMELDAWKKEEERKAVEEAAKKSDRLRKENALSEGRNLYLQKKWYRAINKLEMFLLIKDMDEDLVKDATAKLEESRASLSEIVDPLLGKARSLKEGQDLKGAYETFKEVLESWPSHPESLKEINSIKEELDTRASKIYREALVSESLSLFKESGEKLQEVIQVAPSDSIYYKKAKNKLKNYQQ